MMRYGGGRTVLGAKSMSAWWLTSGRCNVCRAWYRMASRANLAFSGRTLDAGEAREIGLVNRVFESAEALQEGVRKIACRLLVSPLAIRGTKEMLNYGRDHSVIDGPITWRPGMRAMMMSADLSEAMRATVREARAEIPGLNPKQITSRATVFLHQRAAAPLLPYRWCADAADPLAGFDFARPDALRPPWRCRRRCFACSATSRSCRRSTRACCSLFRRASSTALASAV